MRRKRDEEAVAFEAGTGNVFADLGLPNPEQRQLKAVLMRAINSEIKSRNLNQTAAAELVGLTQPDISRLSRGQGRTFSVERLLEVLEKLKVDVEIAMHHGTGKLVVHELV
ncbi:MAG: XRE family transcriptional regulator [Candidatus Eremiobacteraeota bacterium]|nr:XRE family transcriptional regulator [Candidatus Eremiobacteraeota bacterium]